jgi:hypothetical protein
VRLPIRDDAKETTINQGPAMADIDSSNPLDQGARDRIRLAQEFLDPGTILNLQREGQHICALRS